LTIRHPFSFIPPVNALVQSFGMVSAALAPAPTKKRFLISKDEPLAEGEYLLAYRKRGELRLGAESFMFQEGHADLYRFATYGELKVNKKGSSVLAGLCNSDFKPIRPPTAPQSL